MSEVSTTRYLTRAVQLTVALTVGAVFIAVCSSVPGPGRAGRGSWAQHKASRWVLRAVGVRLSVHGAPRSGPSLVVGNHVSWLDILALSASAPMRMVAKSEVARWPLIGRSAARTGTLFLERKRLRELPQAVADMTAALRSGSRVQVFPEATTRCGGALDRFHRAPFQAAINAGVVISPVTVQYLDGDDAGITSAAFVGDETLASSVRRVLRTPRTTVQVHWLRPIPAIAGTGRDHVDRARVAALAQNAVARNLGLPVRRPDGVAAVPTVGRVLGPDGVRALAG
ncbi:lysophospholipid acyltransferase family protein [Nakamurella panacisegetis]|nr:lysophospholipid acyltransferase family protein [Nakamurella panacisegetis]